MRICSFTDDDQLLDEVVAYIKCYGCAHISRDARYPNGKTCWLVTAEDQPNLEKKLSEALDLERDTVETIILAAYERYNETH